MQRNPIDLDGSVFRPRIGVSEVSIIPAVLKYVPSPPKKVRLGYRLFKVRFKRKYTSEYIPNDIRISLSLTSSGYNSKSFFIITSFPIFFSY